jgi:hypothetical protein
MLVCAACFLLSWVFNWKIELFSSRSTLIASFYCTETADEITHSENSTWNN